MKITKMERRERGFLLVQVRESMTNNRFVHHDCILSRWLTQALSLSLYRFSSAYSGPSLLVEMKCLYKVLFNKKLIFL